MEVKFRPLHPSSLARRVSPGQKTPDAGQSFIEMVESVAGAENNSEENPTPSGKRPSSPWQPLQNNVDHTDSEIVEGGNDEQAGAPVNKATTEEKSPGFRFDVTA